MPTPLVLVHGGQHTSRCWQPTIDALRRSAPETPIVAMDLPGRGQDGGDLATATLDDFVQTVINSIDDHCFESVVLVGHSLAGVTIPEVAIRLGPQRIERLVFVAAMVPRNGTSPLDALKWPLHRIAKRASRRSPAMPPLNPLIAGFAFCNGMTIAQRRLSLSDLCGESLTMAGTPVDRSALPAEIPKTWVLTRRDRAVRPRRQRRSIAELGVDDVVEIGACHNVMISHPEELAVALSRYT
jgi:pimeloyl-ACP methyl ester carboxylesterase